jgi:DNA-binding transcriptional regulator YiaG
MTYATKIKKLRDEMLLTQEEFGEILGVSLVLNI